MREITSHRGDAANAAITIEALDPGPVSAPAEYHLESPAGAAWLRFAPLAAGLTNEALLAVVLDRLERFQAGPLACEANLWALRHVQGALEWLKRRSADRRRRGVEGRPVK